MTTPITTTTELEALPEKTPIRDRHGDVGIVQAGKVHYPETTPQTFERTIKKYGPLTVLPGKTEQEVRAQALREAQQVIAGEDSIAWARTASGSSIMLDHAIGMLDDLIADEEAGK